MKRISIVVAVLYMFLPVTAVTDGWVESKDGKYRCYSEFHDRGRTTTSDNYVLEACIGEVFVEGITTVSHFVPQDKKVPAVGNRKNKKEEEK